MTWVFSALHKCNSLSALLDFSISCNNQSWQHEILGNCCPLLIERKLSQTWIFINCYFTETDDNCNFEFIFSLCCHSLHFYSDPGKQNWFISVSRHFCSHLPSWSDIGYEKCWLLRSAWPMDGSMFNYWLYDILLDLWFNVSIESMHFCMDWLIAIMCSLT